MADQLLTGYDSKRLNTLYVDRTLELRGLIQAYSRTNRVLGKAKEFGTIINFQYPKITEEMVNTALKLYGSGGKSSRAIVDSFDTAVEKLHIKISEMIVTLPEPTKWAEIKDDTEEKEAFLSAFKEAAEQLNLVEQYYEFKWDEDSFGIDEHTWMQYTGAYKNLIHKPGTPPLAAHISPLVGKTKLAGTQVIDAAHILSLIKSKVREEDGVQRVNDETLRIIHEQIQELSNMGEDEEAALLKEFVDSELVPGNLSGSLNFDGSFENWKNKKLGKCIDTFAGEWGIESRLLKESVASYTYSQPLAVPFIEELMKSVVLENASNQSAKNRLSHIMTLTKKLPIWMAETKQKYD